MTLRTAILDDDPNSHKAACQSLSAYPEIEIVGQFYTGAELERFLETEKADVLFLDIEMGDDFGFTVAKRLRQTHPELMIVFLTGHSSYAIDGYDFQPVNFLTKPINPVKLEQTILELKRRTQSAPGQRQAQLMFRLQQGYRILNVGDICYIERKDRKNYMHLEGESFQISGYTMRELEQMLAPYGFFLGHQSFIINLYRVCRVHDAGRQLYEVSLRGTDTAVPISRNHYEHLLAQLRQIGVIPK